MLVSAGMALAAHGYSDVADDANTAPDITSLEVVEATAGVLTIRLTVGNFQSLPADSWVNLWFDLDSDQGTGDAGDEALVRYRSDGGVELYAWDGAQLVEGSTANVTASFAAGVLSVSLPRASIAAAESFGILAVSSRAQSLGQDELIASDYAPNAGRSAYVVPGLKAFPDAVGDHDAAPDVTSVRVSDAKSGWITFAITTPNYTTLPSESAIVLTVDADSNPETGEGGAELNLTLLGGEVALDRWNGRRWVPDTPPTRVRARNSKHVVAIDLHVSELGNARRFGFSLLSVDLNTAVEGAVAADVAPNDFSVLGVRPRESPGAHPRRHRPRCEAEPPSSRTAVHGQPAGHEIRHRPIDHQRSRDLPCSRCRREACRRPGASREGRRSARSSCPARRRARCCAGRSASAAAARSSRETSRTSFASAEAARRSRATSVIPSMSIPLSPSAAALTESRARSEQN